MPRTIALRSMVLGLALGLGMTLPVGAADFQKLLPDATDSVLHLKVKELMSSPLAKKYVVPMLKSSLEKSKEAQAAFKALDLDPLEDIDTLTIGAVSGENPNEMDAVIVLTGDFDSEKINAALKLAAKADSEKLEVVKDGDSSFFKMNIEGNGPVSEAFMSVADDKTILMAVKKPMLKSALAKLAGGKPGKLSKEVTSLLTSTGDSTLVIVGLNKSKGAALPGVPPQASAVLEKIESMSIAIGMTDEVSLQLGVGFIDADEASSIGEMMKVYVPQVKQFAGIFSLQKPALKAPLEGLADSIKYDVKGKGVSLKIATTAKNVETIISEMQKKPSKNDD